MPLPTLTPYQPYTFDKPRPSSDLYAISDRLLAQDVCDVVRVEGPIHADLLYYRMAKLHGIDRAGGEVRRVVDRALREATRTGEVLRRGRFYWPAGLETPTLRQAGPRSVDQISPEELRAIVLLVVQGAEAPLTAEELVRATGRSLGFQRTGSSLQAGISATISDLLSAGHLRQRDGTIEEGKW